MFSANPVCYFMYKNSVILIHRTYMKLGLFGIKETLDL